MEDVLVPLVAIPAFLIGLPWLILHYVTKWKQAKSITIEDENLLDELHDIARRLDGRMNSIERIIAADQDAARDAAPHITGQRFENRPVELRARSQAKEI